MRAYILSVQHLFTDIPIHVVLADDIRAAVRALLRDAPSDAADALCSVRTPDAAHIDSGPAARAAVIAAIRRAAPVIPGGEPTADVGLLLDRLERAHGTPAFFCLRESTFTRAA